MKLIIRTILSICLFAWGGGRQCMSQDFEKDISKAQAAYKTTKYYSCDYEVEVRYDNTHHSSITMSAIVSDSNYKSMIGSDIIAICGDKHLLTVDNDLKIIALAKRQGLIMDVPALLSVNDSITYTYTFVNSTEGRHTYVLNYNRGSIASATITIDTTTGYITYAEFLSSEREAYGWKKSGVKKTIVKISKMKKYKDPLPKENFSIQPYVKKEKKKFIGIGAYKSYVILDTTMKS